MNLLELKTYIKQFVVILSILSFMGINQVIADQTYTRAEEDLIFRANHHDLLGRITYYDELPREEDRRVLIELLDHLTDVKNADNGLRIRMLRRILFFRRMGMSLYDYNGGIAAMLDMNQLVSRSISRGQIPNEENIFREIDAQMDGSKPMNFRAIQNAHFDTAFVDRFPLLGRLVKASPKIAVVLGAVTVTLFMVSKTSNGEMEAFVEDPLADVEEFLEKIISVIQERIDVLDQEIEESEARPSF